MKYNNLILINIQMMNCTHIAEVYGNNSINKLFCNNPLLIIPFSIFVGCIFYCICNVFCPGRKYQRV